MADVLEQIQQRQARARDQELAGAQRDYDWNATFGRMAPDDVLRGTRDMTALIASAIERKMALAAQTNAEAQRIYINDQKWKAEQRMQPLKDDRLIAQTRADVARQRAAAAKELLDFSRLERAETAIEHTSKAQWEMDQIESATIPEAEKRAWLNTVRGRYPSMDKDTSARHGTLHAVLNPSDEKIRVAGEIARVREEAKTPPKTDAERIAFEVEKKKALDAVDTPKTDRPSPGTSTAYAKALGEVSGLTEKLKTDKEDDKSLTQAKLTKNQEIVRSLEAQHPGLRETRGLEAPAAQPKMVRQNGVTYALQPDGSYK